MEWISILMMLATFLLVGLALSADKKTEYTEGVELSIPVDDGDHIYAGAMVCVNAAGYAVVGADSTGLIFMGIAREEVDNTDGQDGDINVLVRRRGLFLMAFHTAISIANMGDNVFIYDDESVDVAGNVTFDIYVGNIALYIDTTHAWVDIEPAIKQADVATHIADPSAAHAASAISIADAGNFTTAAQVEAALQEIYQHLLSAYGVVPVPLGAITMEDGTVLTKQATTVAGIAQIGDKEQVIDIPINCTSGESLGFTVPIPYDLDDAADLIIQILASKAADNDALTLDCEVYPCAAGDLQNADIQDTAAQAIVAAGTVLSFTCGADGVLAAPGTITAVLALGGTNDGDAVYIHGAWLKYTKKILTS